MFVNADLEIKRKAEQKDAPLADMRIVKLDEAVELLKKPYTNIAFDVEKRALELAATDKLTKSKAKLAAKKECGIFFIENYQELLF